MPQRDIHDWFEQAVLNKVTGISVIMDTPAAVLHAHHRDLYHTPEEVILLAIQYQDQNNSFDELVIAGLLHILLDNTMTDYQSDMRHDTPNLFLERKGKGKKMERSFKNELQKRLKEGNTFGKKE